MPTVPRVVEQSDRGERDFDIFSRLFSDRIIVLNEPLSDASARSIVAELLLLEAQEPDKDIQLYLNSAGGSITVGFRTDRTPAP